MRYHTLSTTFCARGTFRPLAIALSAVSFMRQGCWVTMSNHLHFSAPTQLARRKSREPAKGERCHVKVGQGSSYYSKFILNNPLRSSSSEFRISLWDFFPSSSELLVKSSSLDLIRIYLQATLGRFLPQSPSRHGALAVRSLSIFDLDIIPRSSMAITPGVE